MSAEIAGIPRPARLFLAGIVLAWLVLGPVARQGFGVRNRWLNAWYMYKGANSRICWVDWSTADGQPVDRLATLGSPPWNRAGKGRRNLTTKAEVLAEASALCRALPGADLRAYARCGHYGGWRVVEDGQRNLCQRSR